MDEHNKNVNNWKNSWKDNWKGGYQSVDDGYQFEGYRDDLEVQNFKQLQDSLQSKDPLVQKKALVIVSTGFVTITIVLAFLFFSLDLNFTDIMTRVMEWIGNK